MKRALIAAAAAVLIAAGCYCGYRYYQADILPEKQLDEANEKQLRLFQSVRPESSGLSATAPTVQETRPDGDDPAGNAPAEADPLEAAEAVNSGIVGWLTVPGTHIDYAVCQAEDNDFYLHNGFDGRYNYDLGCPFLDYRCEPDFSGFNSIVYAHHLKRQRMFADIALFKDESFLRAHPTGSLTLHDGVHPIRFFAYLNVPSTAPAYRAVFVTEGERQEYLDELFDAAAYSIMDAAALPDDPHLILLSTCTYEFDQARGVLVGLIE
ncbi:MAG: class B sortase [Oscillospiraceae bacterium]|nr:class B sortase [Oscillospiraceae bacterium]MBQ8923122.1 class B sortase [Oscillospiraceae bacterium]